MTTMLPSHRRAAIEGEIEMCLMRVERLIARLDGTDVPNEDLEDDDPAGDPLELDGEAPSDDGHSLYAMRPFYGLDQSKGPVNQRDAQKDRMAKELGLVRTPSGGWRQPR